jgi:hypothetical protein
MFNLTLVDQLRLTFGQIVFRQKAHTQTALVLGRVNHWLRASEALLMIGVTIASLAAAYGKGHAYVIVSAVLASLALAVLLIRLAFDFEASANAHRVCSTKLWYLRERYRSLMCDLFDEAVDAETARLHRNALVDQLNAIYETAPPADRQTFQKARRTLAPVDESALTDEEIDQFLPKSLKKTGRSEAA